MKSQILSWTSQSKLLRLMWILQFRTGALSGGVTVNSEVTVPAASKNSAPTGMCDFDNDKTFMRWRRDCKWRTCWKVEIMFPIISLMLLLRLITSQCLSNPTDSAIPTAWALKVLLNEWKSREEVLETGICLVCVMSTKCLIFFNNKSSMSPLSVYVIFFTLLKHASNSSFNMFVFFGKHEQYKWPKTPRGASSAAAVVEEISWWKWSTSCPNVAGDDWI